MLRSARRLLIFASMVTLALNIAEPQIVGQYGKAAFDAVGPLLLIGWSEVAPNLLHAMQTTTVGRHLAEPQTANTPTPTVVERRQPASASAAEPIRDGTNVAGPLSLEAAREARRQDLLHRGRAEDVLHWQQHQPPISAEMLRKRLGIGTDTARILVTQLRTDIHIALDRQVDLAAP